MRVAAARRHRLHQVDDVVADDGELLARVDAALDVGPRPQHRRARLGLDRLELLAELVGGRLVLLVAEREQVLADDGVGRAHEVAGAADHLARADQPLGRVPVVPLDAVAVVLRELVVEVVVALTERQHGAEDAVVRRVLVGEVLRGAHEVRVRERVDEEGRVVDEDHLGERGVEVPAEPVAPAEAADERGGDDAAQHREAEVVLVLVADRPRRVEVRDVDVAEVRVVLLHEHPPDVGEEEAALGVVRVEVGVDVAVVDAVVARPPLGRALEGAAARKEHRPLQELVAVVRAVREHAVVSGGDAEAVDEVEHEGDHEGVERERDAEGDGGGDHERRGDDDGRRHGVDLEVLLLPRRRRPRRLLPREQPELLLFLVRGRGGRHGNSRC
mmetsp:Transcript_5118/g.16228  ORF Transcript_5118/g.16228 Transcript_5118/m.16228 type:complete len:387 (+) Transcript_5118:650-1810(+)